MKKYIFRISYLLFLAYIPGLIMGLIKVLKSYHAHQVYYPYMAKELNASWLLELWPNLYASWLAKLWPDFFVNANGEWCVAPLLLAYYLNPLTWFWGLWPKMVIENMDDFIFGWPIFAFSGWLIYSWIKKPNLVKGVLLLLSSIILNPLQEPFLRLLVWFMSDEPLFQPFYF